MKIEFLRIDGFGKLSDKMIALGSGLNVLEGSNESGKSSVHSFISAIFYGFVKDNVKRATYNSLIDLYAPWSNAKYGGAIRFEYGDKIYETEQNFLKNTRSTSLYDISMSKDITAELDAYGTKDNKRVGTYLFGLGLTEFESVYSVRQNEVSISTASAKSINDKYIVSLTGGFDGVSVLKAKDFLKAKADEIGSERAYTKPYGLAVARSREIKKKIDSLEQSLSEEKSVINDLRAVNADLKSVRAELDKYKNADMAIGYLEAVSRLEARKSLYAVIKNYEEQIDKIKHDGYVTDDEYRDIESKNDAVESLIAEIDVHAEKLSDLETEIEENSAVEEELQKISSDIESLNEYRKAMRFLADRKKYVGYFFGSIILTLLLGIWVVFQTDVVDKSLVIFYALLSLSGLSVLYFGYRMMPYLGKNNSAHAYEDMAAMFERYSIDDRDCDKLNIKLFELKETMVLKAENLQMRKIEAHMLEEQIGYREERIEMMRRELAECFSSCGVKNVSELKERNARYKVMTDIVSKCEEAKRNLAESQKGESDQSIISLYAKYAEFAGADTCGLTRNELDERIEEMRRREVELIERRERKKSLLSAITEIKLAIREQREELYSVEREIGEYDKKLADISLASEIFSKIGAKLYNDSGVELNRIVSQYFCKISDGAYIGVHISDDQSEILLEEASGHLTKPESVSAGTRDQLYMALRMGFMSFIENGGERLPLILDDAFIQYDENRLENILRMLHEESAHRQIIVLTCHRRERDILNNLGLKYNYVEV